MEPRMHKGARWRYKELEVVSTLKIRQWDAAVQVVRLEGFADYTAIFPKGRAPFQRGGLDQRVTVVGTLAKTLLDVPGLAALQAEVAAGGAAWCDPRFFRCMGRR